MRKFHIGGTDISDHALSYLNNLPLLEDINVASCANLTDFGISVLTTLTRLRKLNISGTGATHESLNDIENLNNLRFLNISSCAGMCDTALLKVSKLLLLEELDISYTKMKRAGVHSLWTLKSLRVLYCIGIYGGHYGKIGLDELKSSLGINSLRKIVIT